jgi:carnitine O-acetyltransferase
MERARHSPLLRTHAHRDDPERRSQVARAAGLANACAKFQRLVRTGRLTPDMEKTTPLDMSQYTKLFAAARIPRASRDEMVYHPDSRYAPSLSRVLVWLFSLARCM